MKRVCPILLVLLLALSLILVSCSGENPPSGNTGTKARTEATTEAPEQTKTTTGASEPGGTKPAKTEENTDFDGMDTDDKWTKAY